jgi:LCP family protein required for cell wall assembly
MRNPFKRGTDPFAPSRFGGDMFRSVRTKERKHMRHRWQWITLAVVLVISAAAGWLVWRYFHFQDVIRAETGTVSEEEGKPFNVLLVGSDSRGDLTEAEQVDLGAMAVDGARADTLIVGHIDPAADRVTMVQFPRDLFVPVVGAGEERKINESLLYGRRALVDTVEDLLGITINHYVEVNIAGFRDVVDAIGGVEVCVPEVVPFDPNTGFEVEKPGTIQFDGDAALRFVRSRHAFANGDFDRIANQQKFLSAALRKVTSAGILLHPNRVFKLLEVAERNIRIGKNTTISKLRSILDRFRAFDPNNYEAYIAPNRGVGSATLSNGLVASIVEPDFDAIALVGAALKNNESPAEADGVPNIDPHTIRVGVYNGVDLYQSYASNAADALQQATGGSTEGLQIAEIANAPHFKFSSNLVRYEAGAEQMAELVAALIPGAELQEHAVPGGVDVAVIVGDEEFTTQPLIQILPIPLAKAGEEPPACAHEGRLGDPHGG